MNHSLLVSLIPVLLMTGCASGPFEPAVPDRGTLPSAGDSATYALTMGGQEGELLIQVGAHQERAFPDGTHARTAPFHLKLQDSHGKTYERVAEYSIRDGSLLVIGDLALSPLGSEQFAARTRQWAGSPEGPFDPFRCVAGVVLPARLSLALNPAHPHVQLDAFTRWEGGHERSSPILTENERSVGSLRVEQAENGFWPGTSEWVHPSNRACRLELMETGSGKTPIPWGQDEDRQMRDLPRSPLKGKIPPTGDLGVDIPLARAHDAATREPRVALFLKDYPKAWMVRAEYRGPLHQKAAMQDSDATWNLFYADPGTGREVWVKVTAPAGREALAEFIREAKRDYTPSREVLGDGVISARKLLDPALGNLPPGSGRSVTLSWFTASTSAEVETADSALWQLAYGIPQGQESLIFSAMDGVPIARVRAPEFSHGP